MSRVKLITLALIAVLLVAACVSLITSASSSMQVSADFERVTGLYSGSEVRILGIKVGKVTDVEPQGQSVRVSMSIYSKYKVPADAGALIVPPSLVSDRYVQLAPVYRGGPTMRNKTRIPMSRTQVPVELSTVLKSLDDLALALGPDGANKDGALSKLLTVSANNLRGNGLQMHQTIGDVATLLNTLADNKDNLRGTVDHLATFVQALRNSDGAVRTLTADLASVSKQLSDDRSNLAAALHSLGIALGDVASFVHENRAELTSDVKGLTDVTGTLLKQKLALSEFLDVAPLAIQNLDSTYDPETRSLRTKGDQEQFSNPQLFVCNLLAQLANDPKICNDNPLVNTAVGKLPGGAAPAGG